MIIGMKKRMNQEKKKGSAVSMTGWQEDKIYFVIWSLGKNKNRYLSWQDNDDKYPSSQCIIDKRTTH